MSGKAVLVSRASIALVGLASVALGSGCGSKNNVYYDGGIDALYEQPTLNMTPPVFSFADTTPNAMSEPKDFVVQNLGLLPTGTLSIDLQSTPEPTAFKVLDTNCGKPLQYEETCQVRVQFLPKSAVDFTGRLAVGSPAGGTVVATLSGSSRFSNSSALSLSPGFGDFRPTSTSPDAMLPPSQVFMVSNTGTLRTGPLTVAVTGDADFAKAEDSCVQPLDPGGTCMVSVRFKPTKSGPRSGTLEVTDTGGNVKQIAKLTGTGIKGAQLTLNAPGMFPDVAVGEVFSLLLTLGNSGEEATGALTFTLAGNKDQFMIDPGSCAATLPPANNGEPSFCSFTLTFAPKSVGQKSVGLQVSSNPGGTTNIVQVTANGTLQQTTTISLTQVGTNAFTGVPIGEMRTALFLVENTGTMPTGIPDARLLGGAGEFTRTNNCTVPLAPQDQCTVEVTFTPIDTTPQAVTLFVNANPGGNKALQITSTAVRGGDLVFSNNGFHDFGAHSVTQVNNGTFTFTVRNSGTTQTGPITVGAVEGINAADFLLMSSDCSNRVLTPGQTCSLRFRFQPLPPREPRNRSASITVTAMPGGRPQATFFGTANN
jgi:hypothetical protein